MNSQTYLKECLNHSTWHSFRMQSRTSLNSVLLGPLMSTPLHPLEQVLEPNLPTHPTTTFSSILVLGMIQLILQLPPRGRMYIQLLVLKISMLLRNVMKHISLRTLTHHQMISIRWTKPNNENHHIHPYLGFRGITPESQHTLHPRNLSKHLMVLFMSPLKCISSSALKLFLPLRNTTLKPSTNLPSKEVFISLTLLTMSHPHQRIPHMRNNQTLINLTMYLKMRLTQY